MLCACMSVFSESQARAPCVAMVRTTYSTPGDTLFEGCHEKLWYLGVACPPALACAQGTVEWIKKLWYTYMMEYYSALKRNTFESVPMRWMNVEPLIQSEVSQKEKDKYCILMHICGI